MDIISRLSIGTSTKFITPMVYKDTVVYTDLSETAYISLPIHSTHLSILNKPQFDNKIILNTWRSELNISLCKPSLFVHKIKEGESNLWIFNIPDNLKFDLCLAVGGFYSQFSEAYKKQLLSFWLEDENSRLYGVLYKQKFKRFSQNEYLYSKYEIDHAIEYFTKPLYIELVYRNT